MFAKSIYQPGDEEEEDDEHIIIGHLHMVGVDLEGCEDSRQQETPHVFSPISKHQPGNQRRQISQSPHLPDMSGSDDNQEIGGKSPEDRTQSRQVLTEVEGPQEDIETQEIGKHIPHILR